MSGPAKKSALPSSGNCTQLNPLPPRPPARPPLTSTPPAESNETSATQSKSASRRRPSARARHKAAGLQASEPADSGFQFVTVQNPKIQKDKSFQSNVRRHVMVNYNRAKRGQAPAHVVVSERKRSASDEDDVEEIERLPAVKTEDHADPKPDKFAPPWRLTTSQSEYIHRCIGSAIEPFQTLPQVTKTPFKVATERIFSICRYPCPSFD